MTQEDKKLLLKDLCGRLPYGVVCSIYREDDFKIGWRNEKLTGYFFDDFSYEFYFGESPISVDNILKIKPYLRPLSSMTEEEGKELRQEHVKDEKLYAECLTKAANGDDSMRGKVIPHFSADWCNKNHFDYRGLIPMGLALPCKWLYRLEYKDDSCGLWYNGKGGWCFEDGIGSLDDSCKTKTLPMDYDERYKQDGRDWFSSCSRKEDLTHWYSKEDANKLISNGFIFTRYLVTEFHEYDKETVFIKETCIKREVIDFNELFKDR